MQKIAPSLLSADFAHLAEEIRRVEEAGADLLHIDVMDGHFVPNLTFGPPVVAAIRKITKVPFDVHLMITNPQDLIPAFVEAGADLLTIHVETASHLHRLVQTVRSSNVRVGVALNPATPLSMIEEILPEVDMVLLMSVNPGFGGQKFIPGVVDKIARLRQMATKRQLSFDIEVDGGINSTTAAQVAAAGANILVAGSAVYGSPDVQQAIAALRNAAET